MKPSLVPGLTHTARLAITPDLTVPNASVRLVAFHDMPAVFATAFMVGFIEATCIECLKGHLDEGEHTVGIHVDVGHVAATPVGMSVTARVELTAVESRSLTFRVRAEDEAGLIGEGTHKRAVIRVASFLDRLAEKAARNGRS